MFEEGDFSKHFNLFEEDSFRPMLKMTYYLVHLFKTARNHNDGLKLLEWKPTLNESHFIL